MSGEAMAAEVAEMEMLMKLKDLYGWADDDPKYKKRKDSIFRKYTVKSTGKMKEETAVEDKAPKISSWETVATTKSKDFDQAFNQLSKHIEGEWKSDKFSRGGFVTFDKKSQQPWRRRMTTDGKKFARLIKTDKGVVIQRAILKQDIMGDQDDDEDQEEPVTAADLSLFEGFQGDGEEMDSDVEQAESSSAPPASKRGKKKAEASPAKPSPKKQRRKRA